LQLYNETDCITVVGMISI